jgi:activator of 2-hydroxyglutaryl-CoA dehydratase
LRHYLGIDTGSVSANFALLDDGGELVHSNYIRTSGDPIGAVKAGLKELSQEIGRAHV